MDDYGELFAAYDQMGREHDDLQAENAALRACVAELAAALRAMLADTVAEDGSRRWPSKETVAQAQAALAREEAGE